MKSFIHVTVNLALSEYIESHIVNADSRLCKCREFLFYYLFQKEMHQLAQGIYNVLNSNRQSSQCSSTTEWFDTRDDALLA